MVFIAVYRAVVTQVPRRPFWHAGATGAGRILRTVRGELPTPRARRRAQSPECCRMNEQLARGCSREADLGGDDHLALLIDLVETADLSVDQQHALQQPPSEEVDAFARPPP